MAYTDIPSFLMAYAKSRSFALGFLSSLCIRCSRAGPMPLRKPHSASVFFDLTMQYDRCPVIHTFRSVFVDKMISDYQSGSLRIVYLIKIKRSNYVVPCFRSTVILLALDETSHIKGGLRCTLLSLHGHTG